MPIFVESLNNNVLDILFYIKDLLLKRDGLVIPGLGSFIAEYKSSEIDQTGKKLFPPKKQISFNPSITRDDDHILANSLMSEENISFDEAYKAINEQVENIKQTLQSNKKFEIPGMGTFTLDENNNIRFSEINKVHETLGLIEIEAEPLEPRRPSTQKKTSTKPKPSQKKTKTPHRKGSRKWYWIAAVILLLIGIGGASFYFNFWDNLQVKTFLSGKETKKQEQKTQKTSIAIPDTGKLAKINEKIDQHTDKQKALMYKEQKKDTARRAPVKPKDTNSYHLVVGSFRKKDNAEKFSEQVREKGFKPTILERDNLYRVVVKSFSNKNKALVSLYHFRDTGKIKSVWLLTVSETNQQ